MDAELKILHGRYGETPEEKARWFQSLPLTERMDLLVAFTDLILQVNPRILDKKNAEPSPGRIRVLAKA